MINDIAPLPPIPRCDLGDLVAERDGNIKTYYVDNEHWAQARNARGSKIYFIGKKGFGKSALLQMVRQSNVADHVVDISNQDLGLSLLTIPEALAEFAPQTQRLIFRSAWLATIMTRIRARIGGPQATFGKSPPQAALDFVETKLATNAGGVTGILLQAIDQVSASVKAFGVDLTLELKSRQQGGVSVAAHTQLLGKIQLAAEHFHELIRPRDTFVLLDELDVGWKNDPRQNLYIATLFESIERLSRISTLRFVVSLRVDIFKSLPLESPDKLAGRIHRISWTKADLRRIVLNRLKVALDEPEQRILRRFQLDKAGDPIDLLLSSCFPHPRDAIWTFQTVMEEASRRGVAVVDQSNVDFAIQGAARSRVSWLCNEWQYTFPYLPASIRALAGGVNLYSLEALKAKIGEVGKRTSIDSAVHALLSAGVVGLKFKRDGEPQFFAAGDPPPPPYSKSSYFELHPAIRSAVQSGTWEFELFAA